MGCGASQAADSTMETRVTADDVQGGTSGQLLKTLAVGGSPLHTCKFLTPTVVLAGGRGGLLKLFNIRTGDLIEKVAGATATMLNSAVCPEEGGLFCTTHDDSSIRLWRHAHWQEVQPGETTAEVCQFEGHKHKVYGADFNRDGTMLLTCSTDHSLKLWDVERGTCVHTFTGHTKSVFAAKFSPDNAFALSGGDDLAVMRWDWRLGTSIGKWTGHSKTVWSVCGADNGKECLTAGMEGGAVLWDVTTNKVVQTYVGSPMPTHAAMFSKDQRAVIACGRDNLVRVWDRGDGSILNTMRGHTGAIYSMHISGNHLLTSSFDQSLGYWELPTEAAEDVSLAGIDFDFGFDDDEADADPWMDVQDGGGVA